MTREEENINVYISNKEFMSLMFGHKFMVFGHPEPENIPFILNTGGVQYIIKPKQEETSLGFGNRREIKWNMCNVMSDEEVFLTDYINN